ncbi:MULTISPECIES: hypothetical protein [unclassified Rhodanobacter]|uniref:Mechanosensitive ion channel protein MscS n=1 Tax=Rhodanobacter humi TaxID=1888173 RepID=A0ABV4ARW2_9GAMM
MNVTELKDWLAFLNSTPDPVKSYLLKLFWVLVALLLLSAILKILFSKQFRELYAALAKGANFAAQLGKAAASGAGKALELPEPYPRIAKFFAIVFMANNYAAAFVFGVFALIVGVLSVTSSVPSFLARTAAMLITFALVYFAWFFFAQAEHDRVRLFNRRENSASG